MGKRCETDSTWDHREKTEYIETQSSTFPSPVISQSLSIGHRRLRSEIVGVYPLNHIDRVSLLTGACNGCLSIVDLDSPTTSSNSGVYAHPIIASVKGHLHMITACQWYPSDSGMFVSSSTDKSLKIWDTNSLRPVETFTFDEKLLDVHWSPVRSQNPLIAVVNGSSNIDLVDLRTGSSMQNVRGKKNCCVVHWSSEVSHVLYSGCCDGSIAVWDIRSARSRLAQLKSKNIGRAHSGAVNGLRISPDGLHLISTGIDGVLRRWNTSTCLEECSLSYRDNERSPPSRLGFDLCDESGQLNAFLPSGDSILVMDTERKQVSSRLNGHYNSVNGCVYRRGHTQLISVGGDRMGLMWCPEMDERTGDGDIGSLHVDTWSDEE